jgi:hypothetical protein
LHQVGLTNHFILRMHGHTNIKSEQGVDVVVIVFFVVFNVRFHTCCDAVEGDIPNRLRLIRENTVIYDFKRTTIIAQYTKEREQCLI